MKSSRRKFLLAGAALAGSVPLTSCEGILSRVTQDLGQAIPDHVTAATSDDIDPLFHILQRTSFGVWPGDLERIASMGGAAYIEQQLAPEKIDDALCEMRARRFETLAMDPGMCYEFRREALRKDIVRHTLLRAAYSKKQLFEVMVSFWTDHLNINIDKGDCVYLKPTDDKQVVRAHAFGKFRDLIRASATSPAMLVYLDGKENKKSAPKDIPNENYGRELLELHTLGVDGGYTQKDVFEAARCLTGWRIHDRMHKGTAFFEPAFHDDGEKHVLGQTIAAGGGAADLDRLVDICCSHPATARHIATKLVRKFVADDPPAALVNQVAATFTASGGDIKSLLRQILRSEDFAKQRGTKIKRPFHYIVSCLRATGADTHARPELVEYLSRMGQPLFQFPTPDGYPESPAHWVGTLLWRWNFAMTLAANQVPNVHIDGNRLAQALSITGNSVTPLLAHLLGRLPTPEEGEVVGQFVSAQLPPSSELVQLPVLGLMLACPAFQKY